MAQRNAESHRAAEIRAQLGDLKELAESMRRFRASSQAIAECFRQGRHLGKWLAAYDGRVVAVGESRAEVEAQLREKSVPTAETPIRFLHQDASPKLLSCL